MASGQTKTEAKRWSNF